LEGEPKDVGDMLAKIMEKENQRVELEYQRWQEEKEKKKEVRRSKESTATCNFQL